MKKIIVSLLLITAFFSCKKKEPLENSPITPGISLPTTYNFTNVNYSGQTQRLAMLSELISVLDNPNSGMLVDSTVVLNMFSNTNSPFSDATLNASTKQLKDKCYGGIGAENSAYFKDLLVKQALISSSSSNTWSPGNAGVATSGSSSYFLDENGVQYAELVKKGLMGAIFYYQIAEVYTRPGKIGNAVDNTTVTDGEGTAMEHHWDEAFGYWGAPIDYSVVNNSNGKFYAKYSRKGDAVGLNTTDRVMEQFIKGRYGISNKNYTFRDEAAAQVRKEFEMILVTTAIHYLNTAKANFSNDAIRNNTLSEAYGFILSLAYNSDKLISTTDLATVKNYFEEVNGQVRIPSFLNVTVSDINNAIDMLSATYGLDAVKSTL